MSYSRARLSVLMVLAVAGCASRPDVLTLDAPRPAVAPEAVALLLDQPDRSFETLALIRSSHRNLFNDVEDLKAEVRRAAAELGADAVILSLSSHEAGGGTGVTAEGQVVLMGGSSDSLRVIGRAIVYTDG